MLRCLLVPLIVVVILTFQYVKQNEGCSMLDNWEENLAVISANRTENDHLVIIHLGDCLLKEKNDVCYPLSFSSCWVLLLFVNFHCLQLTYHQFVLNTTPARKPRIHRSRFISFITRPILQVTAAHICYLVAEAGFELYSDSARLCLIGADHWNSPRTYANPEAIQVLFCFLHLLSEFHHLLYA